MLFAVPRTFLAAISPFDTEDWDREDLEKKALLILYCWSGQCRRPSFIHLPCHASKGHADVCLMAGSSRRGPPVVDQWRPSEFSVGGRETPERGTCAFF